MTESKIAYIRRYCRVAYRKHRNVTQYFLCEIFDEPLSVDTELNVKIGEWVIWHKNMLVR